MIGCEHPTGLARFWSAAFDGFAIRPYDDTEIARLTALGHTPETDPTVLLDGTGIEICFQLVDVSNITGKRRLHLDIEATGDLNTEVQRLIELGATVVARFDEHVWMRDPEGNDFCLTR